MHLREQKNKLEFLALYGMSSLAAIIFVSKGGTVDYIYTIGEPYVAIFTGCLFSWVFRPSRKVQWAEVPMFHRVIAGLAFASALLMMGWREHILAQMETDNLHLVVAQMVLEPLLFVVFATLVAVRVLNVQWRPVALASIGAVASLSALAVFGWHSSLVLRGAVFEGGTYQLPEERTEQIAQLIRDKSHPRDPLISPPWFAYDSGRLLAREYSETFIWTIGYFNEANDRIPGQQANVFDGPFTKETLDVAEDLRERKIPLVILDDEQTGQIPEIKEQLYGNAAFPFLTASDIKDPVAFLNRLKDTHDPVSARIFSLMLDVTLPGGVGGKEVAMHLRNYAVADADPQLLDAALACIDRAVIAKRDFYDPKTFAHVSLSDATQQMARKVLDLEDAKRLNRRLLAEAYPG